MRIYFAPSYFNALPQLSYPALRQTEASFRADPESLFSFETKDCTMKRVRQFQVDIEKEDKIARAIISGWHQTWSEIADVFAKSDSPNTFEAIVYDDESKMQSIVAIFSPINLQRLRSEQEVARARAENPSNRLPEGVVLDEPVRISQLAAGSSERDEEAPLSGSESGNSTDSASEPLDDHSQSQPSAKIIQRVDSPISWDTELVRLGDARMPSLFANRNAIDFQWGWVDGAKHEVPFRLSGLARTSRHAPRGLRAYALSLVTEFFDLVRRR